MASNFASMRNIRFLLYEVFNVQELTAYDYYRQHSRKMFDMVLDAAFKLAKDMLRPMLREMDEAPPVFSGGELKVHPNVRKMMKEYGEGGWISASFPEAFDGEQLPETITNCCRFLFASANYSASVYAELTSGAAHLITAFAGQDLIETYVPNMLSGKWQGTMALTEPQAGSSLADIATRAFPVEGGRRYRISGQKIFISAGDHDGADNIVHLLLARIEGAPAGVKGISLFIVPKFRPGSGGRLVGNDVVTSQVYHKLGYRGAPIVELSLGEKNDCIGWIVGEPNQGLRYMFQMMNETRLGVGFGAAAIASAAYHAAVEYARERCQGRNLTQKDPQQPPIPIIRHPDVKRMLLFQKAVVEGALSLLLQCSKYADLKKICSGKDREECSLLLDLLTPVAKSYPSEMGILSTSQALQCFGGYGYCQDFPVEQYYRDVRIHPIHEGTTGIQGIDLLGRKVMMQEGKAFALFSEKVQQAIANASDFMDLKRPASRLQEAFGSLEAVTRHLKTLSDLHGPEVFLADATLYLELFGIVSISWQWLLQAITATERLQKPQPPSELNFYTGKLYGFRYFFAYELPKSMGLAKRLLEVDPLTVEMKSEFYA